MRSSNCFYLMRLKNFPSIVNPKRTKKWLAFCVQNSKTRWFLFIWYTFFSFFLNVLNFWRIFSMLTWYFLNKVQELYFLFIISFFLFRKTCRVFLTGNFRKLGLERKQFWNFVVYIQKEKYQIIIDSVSFYLWFSTDVYNFFELCQHTI